MRPLHPVRLLHPLRPLLLPLFCCAAIPLAACTATQPATQPPAHRAPLHSPQAQAEAAHDTRPERVLIIFYDQAVGAEPLLAAVRSYGAEVVYRYNALHGMAIALPANRDVSSAMRHFQQVRGVLQVGRNQVHHLH